MCYEEYQGEVNGNIKGWGYGGQSKCGDNYNYEEGGGGICPCYDGEEVITISIERCLK